MAEFFEPAPGQCTPAIEGVCLGWPGVDLMLEEQRRRERDWKIALIDADERAQLAEAQAQASERRASSNAWWATWGWPIVLGSLVAGGVGGIVVGSQVRR